MLEELDARRRAAGWTRVQPGDPRKASASSRCAAALAFLRAGGSLEDALDRIRAVVWYWAKQGEGHHANFERCFRPSKDGQDRGWVEMWIAEGRPSPLAVQSSKGRTFIEHDDRGLL